MFALCDCNSFYCSCEAVFQPRLRGKPVVVLSNNDGCVIARSPEAKACGIPMGAPAFQWREQFEAYGVEVFSSNYALYGDMCRRVMQVLGQHSAAVEVYSIDEAFLSLDGMAAGQMEAYAWHIRETVRRWTGIPIGVGVAATKVLAKLANRQAKKTGGVCVLDHESAAGRALIEAWPVGELWGVAGRLEKRLALIGIHTAGDLARAARPMLRRKFGVVMERMSLELGGTSCLALEEVQPDRKNICCSRSFGRPVEDLDELREAVATHATRAGEKLRRQGLVASAVCVFLMTNRHREDLPQYHPQAGRELLVPSSFTPELVGETCRVLKAIYRPSYRYVKAGVLCLELVPDDEKQTSLFVPVDPEREAKEQRLMAAADALNLHYGRGTVRMATAGMRQDWQMRRERMSPCYTTRLEDVPTATV